MKPRDYIERHYGRRPSAHPLATLQAQAKRMKALAVSAARRCNEVEKYDAVAAAVEKILREKSTPKDD